MLTRALDLRFGSQIAFLDDYDLHVAHFLVSGGDVWLNTPWLPLEACGTTGLKAAMNGVLHLEHRRRVVGGRGETNGAAPDETGAGAPEACSRGR